MILGIDLDIIFLRLINRCFLDEFHKISENSSHLVNIVSLCYFLNDQRSILVNNNSIIYRVHVLLHVQIENTFYSLVVDMQQRVGRDL